MWVNFAPPGLKHLARGRRGRWRRGWWKRVTLFAILVVATPGREGAADARQQKADPQHLRVSKGVGSTKWWCIKAGENCKKKGGNIAKKKGGNYTSTVMNHVSEDENGCDNVKTIV